VGPRNTPILQIGLSITPVFLLLKEGLAEPMEESKTGDSSKEISGILLRGANGEEVRSTLLLLLQRGKKTGHRK